MMLQGSGAGPDTGTTGGPSVGNGRLEILAHLTGYGSRAATPAGCRMRGRWRAAAPVDGLSRVGVNPAVGTGQQYFLHFMPRSSVPVQTTVALVPSRASPLQSPEHLVTSESWHGASVLP